MGLGRNGINTRRSQLKKNVFVSGYSTSIVLNKHDRSTVLNHA